LVGNQVADPVKFERRVVRNHPSSQTPEGPPDQILTVPDREVAKPKDTSIDLEPVAAVHVVVLESIAVSGGEGLMGSEVPALPFGDREQPGCGISGVSACEHA